MSEQAGSLSLAILLEANKQHGSVIDSFCKLEVKLIPTEADWEQLKQDIRAADSREQLKTLRGKAIEWYYGVCAFAREHRDMHIDIKSYEDELRAVDTLCKR